MRLDVTAWEGVNKALLTVGGGGPHCRRWEPASLGSCEWHVSGAYAGHDRPSSVQARSKHRQQPEQWDYWAQQPPPTVGETAANNSSGTCVQCSTLTLARIPCSPSPFWVIWLHFSTGKEQAAPASVNSQSSGKLIFHSKWINWFSCYTCLQGRNGLISLLQCAVCLPALFLFANWQMGAL